MCKCTVPAAHVGCGLYKLHLEISSQLGNHAMAAPRKVVHECVVVNASVCRVSAVRGACGAPGGESGVVESGRR
jgi:hypothetical protein